MYFFLLGNILVFFSIEDIHLYRISCILYYGSFAPKRHVDSLQTRVVKQFFSSCILKPFLFLEINVRNQYEIHIYIHATVVLSIRDNIISKSMIYFMIFLIYIKLDIMVILHLFKIPFIG